MFGTVALWLAPGSIWRPIAVVLLLQWAVAEAIYQQSGVRLPRSVYIVGDLIAIGAALFKRSHWSDWIIIAPYPFAWWLYAQPETRWQWIALFWIALAQFIVAGPWPAIQRSLGAYSHGSVKGPLETRHGGL